MKLNEIFPLESYKAKFDKEIRIENRDKSKIGEIAVLKPSCMVGIGGGAWDRYVRANQKTDPQALAEFFQKRDPKLYLAMERYTGIKVLKELSYTVANVVDVGLPADSKSELLLAVVYPNVLVISDVTFANPYKPISQDKKRFRFQEYEGLGLFPELMQNCEEYCKQLNIDEITLTAAYIDLVPFFKKHGFQIEDTPAGKISLNLGEGIPMAKKVIKQ